MYDTKEYEKLIIKNIELANLKLELEIEYLKIKIRCDYL